MQPSSHLVPLLLKASSHLVPLLMQASSHLVPLLLQATSLHFLVFFIKAFYFFKLLPEKLPLKHPVIIFITIIIVVKNYKVTLLTGKIFSVFF